MKVETGLRRRGFALLIVIWGLGAIALLVVSFLSTGRLRLQTAFNVSGAARAESVAAAAVDLAILALAREHFAPNVTGAPPVHEGAPRFCSLDDSVIAWSVEDEGGKVDLNAASEPLLRDLFTGLLAMSPEKAGGLARAVLAFRAQPEAGVPTPPVADGRPFAPKRTAFESALELDQVAGIDGASFHAILPFVTVHSRAEGIDPQVAPPALFAALVGARKQEVAALVATPFPNRLNRDDPRFPSAYRRAGTHGAFLVHAESALREGPSGLRESIVEMESSGGGLYTLREVRRGRSRYLDELDRLRADPAALAPC
jgi:general secretion pathway protein K